MKCCICNKEIEVVGSWDLGCDARPIAEGRCCHKCDTIYVTSARIKIYESPNREHEIISMYREVLSIDEPKSVDNPITGGLQ
jgi:hypothetical protein